MRGDFVLYKPAPGDFAGWLINHFTNGPYDHVEIDLGNGMFVGEHGAGITVHTQDIKKPAAAFVTPVGDIAKGMEFVNLCIEEEQKNPHSHEYGWLDIASDALKIMGSSLILRREGHWDCSHFIALYLIAAGAAAPLGNMAKHPETISPNDLARAYGVIK